MPISAQLPSRCHHPQTPTLILHCISRSHGLSRAGKCARGGSRGCRGLWAQRAPGAFLCPGEQAAGAGRNSWQTETKSRGQCWSCVRLLNLCFMSFCGAKLTGKWRGNGRVPTPGTVTQIAAEKQHRLLRAGLCRASFPWQGLGCAPGGLQTSSSHGDRKMPGVPAWPWMGTLSSMEILKWF